MKLFGLGCLLLLSCISITATKKCLLFCAIDSISITEQSPCTQWITDLIGKSSGNDNILDLVNNLGVSVVGNGLQKLLPSPDVSPTIRGRTLLNLGGPNGGSMLVSKVLQNPLLQRAFVNRITQLVTEKDFRGSIIDLTDLTSLSTLAGSSVGPKQLISLFDQLQAKRPQENSPWIVAIIPPVDDARPAALPNVISKLSQSVNFVIVTVSGSHNLWDGITGESTSLYPLSKDMTPQAPNVNIDNIVRDLLAKGVPQEKLILGVSPFRGIAYTSQNPQNNDTGYPASGPGILDPRSNNVRPVTYCDIQQLLKQGGWTVKRDDKQQLRHMLKGDEWILYEDRESVAAKVKYVLDHNLAGLLFEPGTNVLDCPGSAEEYSQLLKSISDVIDDQQ